MAGSIPPLISSTPPPLCPFDDDEEEDEDEFGMYAGAEELDYNECISFKDKNEEKPAEGNSRGEQDSTSQDSATDSGLCQDSEGMSPTPHSDDERSVKPSVTSVCDELCQSPAKAPTLTDRLTPVCEVVYTDSPSRLSPHTDIPNGHLTAEEDPEDDFGNLLSAEVITEECMEQIESSQANPKLKLSNSISDQEIIDHKVLNGNENLNSLHDSHCDNGVTKSGLQAKASNENQSFTYIDTQNLSRYTLNTTYTNEKCKEINEQPDTIKEFTLHKTVCTSKSEANIEIKTDVNVEDDNFDDFNDFQADFSSFNGANTEGCDKVTEHSHFISEHFEGASSSCVPNDYASDDEFSDFTEFASSNSKAIRAESSNSVDNLDPIPNSFSDICDFRTESEFQEWTSVFAVGSSDPPPASIQSSLLKEDDPVWARLVPLELSPALSYQWTESLANRNLLAALNIDSRNILMMPWMPRFAANLSGGPLQPVKALEPLQPTPAPAPSPAPAQPSSGQEVVPDAHFDWVGSGLTNPLDSSHSSLLDLNFMVTLASHISISPKTLLKQQKSLSPAAESILSSLPDILFIRKTYFDFPVKEG